MDIILIGGLWLGSAVWDTVAAELESYGHRALPLALPGVDDRSTTATLDDQIATAVAAVDATDHPVVVGHSAACSMAWVLADRRPEAIRRVVLVGGFPATHNQEYANFFETVNGVMPFPGWGPFEGADSADLNDIAKQRLAAEAIPVPQGVTKGIVRLHDERRFRTPITVVCPEFTPEDAKQWIGQGEIPELARASDLSFVDLDSGHWPMVTAPGELARIIHEATQKAA